ncbi:hypothetical protein FH972_002849 [Carpinus fangiana]|uniref:Bulb-type lectin domain-containing protein n=1 Tax=Carpinus fangiana TaxID=176857 RepID=A0A5N6QJJ2_9ROSI|nr:hypothetical protein FH972_002849 [Carpinus fangiana]
MAGIPEKTIVWTANRDEPPVSSDATLLFASDGRLVLQMGQEQVAVVAESSGSASASMLNSGNFVIYNSDQGIIWQSFDHPTDTLLPSQCLFAGHEIVSSISETQHSTGIFRLKMQTGGNLVQYPVDTPDTAPYSYFATSAGGLGDNVTLNFDDDGHLYLLNATGFNIITNLTNGAYLADCNCEAVLLKDGKCRKQRLPLRYGRRQLSDTDTALVKSVDWNLSEEEAVLEEWAYHCFEAGELAKLLGNEEVDKKQLERMIKLGLWCIQDEPSLRPSMKKVLLMLEGTIDIPIPPSLDSFPSAI